MRRSRRLLVRIALILVATALAAVVFVPWLAPRVLGLARPDVVFRVDDGRPERTVYLTIDDGPSNNTAAILTTLARQGGVHATFFVSANQIGSGTRLQGIRAQGHALGHHMDSTKPAADYDLASFEEAFDRTDRLLEPFGAARLYRPPSGLGTREQSDYARRHGYVTVVGTAYPMDHTVTDPARIAWLAEWMCTDGAIIILHDGAERGRRTVEVLEELIPALRARGYRFGDLEKDLRTRTAP